MQSQQKKQPSRRATQASGRSNATANRKQLPKKAAAPKQNRVNNNNRKKPATCLSQLTCDYARSLADPCSGPARMPAPPTLKTALRSAWSKGTFKTGTAGWGWVACSPEAAVFGDITSLFHSSLSSTGNQFEFASPNVSVTTNSPYTLAQAGPGIQQFQYRIVSSCLRIKWAGTVFDKGGSLVGLQTPNHSSLVTRNANDMLAIAGSREMPISSNWTEIRYTPNEQDDFDFQGSYVRTDANYYYMGFMVQAAAGAAQPFSYEFYVNYETTGYLMSDAKPSFADTTGMSSVLSAVQQTNLASASSKPPNEVAKGFIASSTEQLNSHTSGLQTFVDVLGVGAGIAALVL
jgi:hypothetical protein